MDQHVRTLARLCMLFGSLTTVIALFALIWHKGLSNLWQWAHALGGLGPIVAGSVLFHLVIGPPTAVVAIFLNRFDEWARFTMVILCAINVLNPPFGTALGLYGLWVLLRPETEPLFLDPVLRRNRSSRPPP